MEIPKLVILLCCLYCSYASHEGHHTIPVEGYKSELQNLGEHVEIPETPVKVIKITKTIAVKIPVPYPVKVIEKVPYPVHVAKPYPVPVPQIVKVPQPHGHKGASDNEGHHQPLDVHSSDYQVQEDSYGEGYPSDFSSGHNYGASDEHAPGNGHPVAFEGDSSNEGTSYDQAIQKYLQTHQNNFNGGGNHGHKYY